ncbi:MAG: hypothetical protein KH813_03875 [Negativicoccus succinicivorans]|uniref:hypothetical protein n=1 Tax=Negativicoccus succinicivorans TaxID=620903 RepID=UPI0026ED4C4C|nr:hypothetical protein [Negativicoccus succinicivorans]MBS6028543.1 hypothetical protein [Negativicoccus succinicivorans]
MISYEEYRAIVVRSFKESRRSLSDEEVEAYFEREGNEITRARYEDDVESLKEGKITERVLERGCPASVAYCLSLMY